MWVRRVTGSALLFVLCLCVSVAPAEEKASLPIEVQPKNPDDVKIVLIAGSNYFKKGEHDYIAGCRVLMDLLRQTKGVAPVLALDWPKKAETLTGAKAIVFYFDGGDKHALLKKDRLAQVQTLSDAGVGLVFFHQTIDFPKDFGDRIRTIAGAAWEKGYSQRAHWVTTFRDFPDHPITRGVTPFKIDDGWIYKLRFAPQHKGVTPLLKTVSPKAKVNAKPGLEATVSFAYERTGKGRAFIFTGCHLHSSLAEEGYRRYLVNGILWSAGQTIPATGAPVALKTAELGGYLTPAPSKKKK